jgi:acyl dehydratase
LSLYLDDLKVGDRFTSRSQVMDAGAIIAFAGQFDPQPFHLDAQAAHDSLFGGLVASGWHTAATAMRLMLDGGFPVAGGIIGTNADLRFLLPVRAGDELHVECEVLEVAPSRSKSDRGTVRIRCNTVNQHGRTALRMETAVIVFRRPQIQAS